MVPGAARAVAGAGGGGATMFGGPTGPFRLLQTGLGDQAGWLLGLRRGRRRSALLVAHAPAAERSPHRLAVVVGGAFACTAVVFSFASGIFHPYYVSLLAPFVAALVGGGVGEMLRPRSAGSDRAAARVIAPRP